VKRTIIERFGGRVLDEEGEIDRGRVGEIVFGDPAELRWLEALLHPQVVATYLRWRDDLSRRPEPPAVCVTEVPLLYEVGGESQFDVVVVITAPSDVRIARRIGPLGERERRLLPDEEKAARAEFVYVNDGSLEELDTFVSGVMEELSA
jgi:dephospho-CoA kinase